MTVRHIAAIFFFFFFWDVGQCAMEMRGLAFFVITQAFPQDM
jgi:hypothetical protein